MSRVIERPSRARRELPPEPEPTTLPDAPLPVAPRLGTFFSRFMIVVFVILGVVILDHTSETLLNFWLLQDLGLDSVFWTNFKMGTVLFAIMFVALLAAVAAPAYLHRGVSRTVRRGMLQVGLVAAVIGGMYFSGQNKTYLAFFGAKEWGKTDPVFGYDLGFWIFRLPALQRTQTVAFYVAAAFFISALICAWIGRPRANPPAGMGRVGRTVGILATRVSRTAFAFLAATIVARLWLDRYGLLLKRNLNPEVDDPRGPDRDISVVPDGADVVDVTGFFSSLNGIWVEMLAVTFMTLGTILLLGILHRAVTSRTPPADWRRRLTVAAFALALLPGITMDYSFKGITYLREMARISPNEPVIQIPYLKRAIDATNEAWGLDKVERVPFTPNGPGDPMPTVEALLADPALKNAPLWPGFAAWLEQLPDPEYVQRIFLDQEPLEPHKIYGPTLDVFNQQQKLRPYYSVIDTDWVRYKINGEDRLFATGVREMQLDQAQGIFIAWWGQPFMLFTHGHGLVMAATGEATEQGLPVFASRDVPSKVTHPELKASNEAVYFGEATGTMAFTNLEGINEFDRASEQGRVETRYPPAVDSGVRVDSVIKRAAMAWKSRQVFEVLFSDLIKSDSRAFYSRTPVDRLKRVAPFLYYDSDPYAVVANDGIHWMVNGMTTASTYPYSAPMDLGDKAFRRTPVPHEPRWVNYARDSVKATVDAYTGDVKLYKYADEPVLNTWAGIYPALFEERSEMPPPLRDQVQYPPQLFHTQFDDLYIEYHMTDPLTFFNLEDPFDDGDEVLGALLTPGKAVTFSMDPYYWIAKPGGALPASSEPSQFTMSMIFTPEAALNVRAIASVYMGGEDYGKLSVLSVPKSQFFVGPEQADAAIDQDAFISQQISLWNRLGLTVIRGHTTPIVVQRELLYIEPIFIVSEQNPVPQLKRVAVVFRGKAALGETLEEALRNAINPPPRFPVRPGPELGGEPGFVRSSAGFQEQPRAGGLQSAVPRDPTQVPR